LAGGAAAGAQELPATGLPPPAGEPAHNASSARLAISGSADGWFPTVFDADADIAFALGGTTQLSFAPLPFVEALGRAGVYSMSLASNESVLYIGGSAGLGFVARLFERMSVGLSGWAGLGKVPYGEESIGLIELGARLETSFRLTAAMTLGVSAGYENLSNPIFGTFLDALSASLRIKLIPAEMSRDRMNLAFSKITTQAIFPVFRSWYDTEPLGTVTIRNNEEGPIENVRVSFYAPEYMGGPRICQVVQRIERGASVTIPLYAVFDERILALTENGSTSAEIDVDYSFLGSQRSASEGLTLSLHHRNAMSWEDDRRAAAFVSPTDPAALWFSRYASSVVRDRMRSELPANLQFALGIFESLKLYGLNYVIDPNSSYIEMSENAAVVDYLQYPSQTLMYRGGDCDDLSILYSSLLESSGIATAFITIPGHIYMAFKLGMTEAEALEKFFDPGLLIFRDGQAWAPVEITMVKEGFVKAWRVGAKQWIDNDKAGSAAFYPMEENWALYRPSGLQDAAARFALPDEAKAMAAFDDGVDRFITRELEPIVAEYEKRLASKRDPEVLNEYGTAMAKVGMLDPAWERFSESAKAGYTWAWNNLASIAFVRKDYKLAYSYYQYTTTLLPGDPVAVLGMARCAYELDRYSESEMLFAGLKETAPALAQKYNYLASAYGGSGRAWSMADRLNGSIWSRPGLTFELPSETVAPAIAAAPPAPVETIKTPASPAPTVISPAASSFVVPPPEPEMEATVLEPTIIETEPVKELVAAPEQEAEAAVLEPAIVETEPTPELVAAPELVATPEPEAVPDAAAVVPPPPAIVEAPPADAEIEAKAAEAAAVVPPPPAIIEAPVPETENEPAASEPLTVIEPSPVQEPVPEAETAKAEEPAPVTIPEPIAETARINPGQYAPAARFTRTVERGGAPAFGKRLPEGADASGYERIVVSAPEPAVEPTITVSPPLNLGATHVKVASGTWSRSDSVATMTDAKAMYAKLVVASPGVSGAAAYEFKARAMGSGWVGFGIHLHGQGTWKMTSYGGGDSILVWITSDPKTFGDASPRLQVYRSTGEVTMKTIASVKLAGSAFELRDYRIEYDPAAGTLAVFVDGVAGLHIDNLENSPDSDYLALRALDLAEFSDVRITPLNVGHPDAETTP